MICSKCGQECAEGAKFCTHCGADLTVEKKEEVTEASKPEEELKEESAEVKDAKDEAAESKEEAATEAPKEEEAAAEAANQPEAVSEPVSEPEKAEEKVEDKVEEKKDETEIVPSETEKKAGGFDLSKILKIAIPVAVVFLLIIIIANACKGEKYIKMNKNTVVTVMNTEEGAIALLNSGKTVKSTEVVYSSVRKSGDSSIAVFMNEEKEMIVFNGKKFVNTGIDEVANIFVSAGGDTIAYFRDVKDEIGTLYLYYVKNGKVKEISDDVHVDSAVLSPNGKTVAFISDFDAADDFKGYYSVDGKKPVEVGKEKRVFAIADKAKYLYYVDDDRIYSSKRKGDGEKLASDISSYVSVFMNADHSEILVYHDEKMYISVKAKEKKKVSNNKFTDLILPSNALKASYECEAIHDSSYNSTRQVNVTETGVDTFEEQLFATNEGIEFLSAKLETTSIMRNVYTYVLSEDRKTLSVMDFSRSISKITDFKKGGRKTLVATDEDISSMYVDGKMKYFYFVNDDDELWMTKGKKAKKIADDVTSVSLSVDGKICYFMIEGEELYCSTNGGKKKEIKSAEDGSVSRMGTEVYLGIEDDDEIVVYLLNGKKLKEVIKTEN